MTKEEYFKKYPEDNLNGSLNIRSIGEALDLSDEHFYFQNKLCDMKSTFDIFSQYQINKRDDKFELLLKNNF